MPKAIIEHRQVAKLKGTYVDALPALVNKKTGEWGLAYDANEDLGKVKMQMSKPPSMVESLWKSVPKRRAP